MSSDVVCPSCGATYKYRPEFAGKRVTCTRCKSPFDVGGGATEPTPRRAPPPPPPAAASPPPPPAAHESEIVRVVAPQNEPFEIKQSAQGRNSVVDILEYSPLRGCQSMAIAQSLYFAHQQGMMLRQARITLDRGGCQLQAGMLQFLRGAISIETDVKGVGGFLAGAMKGVVTGETAVKPRYTGVGQIFLEPTFGQMVVAKLENEEMVIADGMFYAVESTIAVQTTSLASLSAGLFGGQGFFQTSLQGTGWVVLALPVPEQEILRYTLNGPHDELKIDGAFGLLRRGNVTFSVEKSTKTWVGSAVSGEGLLQTFRGAGEVWVAPTMAVYENLRLGGLHAASGTDGNNAAKASAAGNAANGIASLVRAFAE